MSNAALKFVERAERYALDRKRLAGDGESVARYVLNCAERVSMLDDRVFSVVDRESCMARIWSAYQECLPMTTQRTRSLIGPMCSLRSSACTFYDTTG